MKWYRGDGNRRLDAFDLHQLGRHAEEALRIEGLGQYGSGGLVYLPSIPAYNTSTRQLTMPAGTIARDASGNPIYLTEAVESEPVDAADVGTANLYLWCAIEPAAIEATTRNRVYWKSAGQEETRARHVEWHDRISFAWGLSQPPDTASGTEYFRVLKYTGWSGSPPAPTGLQPWWWVDLWREQITSIGDVVPGATNTLARMLVILANNIIGGAAGSTFGSQWRTALESVSPLTTSLAALAERLDDLEAWLAAMTGVTQAGVPLVPVAKTGDGWGYTSAEWQTLKATESLVFEVPLSPGWKPAQCHTRIECGANTTATATLARRNIGDGTTTTLGAASWAAGESGNKLVAALDWTKAVLPESYKYTLTIATGGADSPGPTRVKQAYLTGAWPTD